MFKMLGSTPNMDARDNTGTTGVGVPIYWLNGAKVADNYADFYDGSWDEEAQGRRETGLVVNLGSGWQIWTGSTHQGTELFGPGNNSRALGQSVSGNLVGVGKPSVQTLARTLALTGCRVSEAPAIRACDVDLEAAELRIGTLKRRTEHWRAVPVPQDLITALDLAHRVRAAQASRRGRERPLWPITRQGAHRQVGELMRTAGIVGPQACPRGLRHAYGVAAVTVGVPADHRGGPRARRHLDNRHLHNRHRRPGPRVRRAGVDLTPQFNHRKVWRFCAN